MIISACELGITVSCYSVMFCFYSHLKFTFTLPLHLDFQVYVSITAIETATKTSIPRSAAITTAAVMKIHVYELTG